MEGRHDKTIHWLRDKTIHWLPYKKTLGQSHLAVINKVLLIHQGASAPRMFVLDTGASRSFAPEVYATGLIDLGGRAVEDSGAKDVRGQPLLGIPVELDLELQFYYPTPPLRVRETLWFCKGLRHGLLGQSTFLEQCGAIFLNFLRAEEGRRFGLLAPTSPG
jgi:hypothetical protein